MNLAVLEILGRASRESLNRGAYLHIATDLAAFIGTAIVALILDGWDRRSHCASILVAGPVFAAAYELLKESGRIFLEAAPVPALPADVGRAIVAHEGVVEAHDPRLDGHERLPGARRARARDPGADCHRIRLELERMLHERFGIDHTTLQVEHAGSRAALRSSLLPLGLTDNPR